MILFITAHSSPIGNLFVPEAITFSITVEPHLGTPTINIGFIASRITNPVENIIKVYWNYNEILLKL